MPEGQASENDLRKDRDYLMRRLSEMQKEYMTFQGHYKELSEFIDPRRGRFFLDDRNKGDKRHKNIINNKATRALRKSTAGMLAGAMSPSRPWFTWSLMDKDLLNNQEVKEWLDLLQRIILLIFNKSNFYNMAPNMLRELLLFGTGCMTHVDDFDDVARFYTHTAGSFYIAQNHKLSVDTLARKFQMTSYQLVKRFGLANVSTGVKNSWDKGNYGTWHNVCQFIELNPFRDPGEIGSEFMPFRSVYFEPTTRNAADKNKFLSRSGFQGFPAYVPRWETLEGDIYSVNCPGMTNLGDIKQLQTQEKEKAKAIAKQVAPPLQGPPAFQNQPIPNVPGGVAINTASATGQKIEAIYKVDPKIQEMMLDIQQTERRIDEGFYVDLFMAITDQPGVQPKNELQLSQINEERLLQIGPVLEQIHGEWLDRMVHRVAAQVIEADIMPEAPEALQGQELELEFVSALAMAQRSISIGAIERTMGFAGGMAQNGFEQVMDKVNPDKAFEEYAHLVGFPARLIVPDDEAQQARQQRQQAMQQAQQLEQAAQGANVAKMLSDAKLGDDNVLSSAVGREEEAA
jgi:hypothetical protein